MRSLLLRKAMMGRWGAQASSVAAPAGCPDLTAQGLLKPEITIPHP